MSLNISGTALPPVMIFPRVHFKHHMLHGAPPGTLGLANPSGWMNSELFVAVMRHFIQHSNSSKTNPTLLILDNHESHFSVETLNLAKDNGVTMLTLPPHCSNKLQPLDVAVYAPFKTYYNSALDSWMMRNPGKPITIFQIAKCVGYAFDKSMTPSNIKAGFKKCGIVPFDRYVFDENDFLISNVTDRNATLEESDTNRKECQPSCSKNLTNIEPGLNQNVGTDEKHQLFKSPEQLFGYPKAEPRKNLKIRRKGRSKIVTDTPEKLEIEEKYHEKKRKEAISLSKSTKRRLTESTSALSTSSSSDTQTDSFVSDSSDAESFIDFEFDRYHDLPEINSYVLVEFHDKKSVFYVAKVIEVNDNDFKVTFLRHSAKNKNTFLFPNVEDISYVNKSDVRCVLPPVLNCGGTKRQKSFISFGIKFDNIDIR